MSIKVKFFGSLKESIEKSVVDAGLDAAADSVVGPGVDAKSNKETLSNLSVDNAEIATALDVWNHVTGNAPVGEQVFCSINLEHSEMDQPVNDGDEVAFFPPVTGG